MWRKWLEEQRRNAAVMDVNQKPLKDTSGWGMQDDGDRFGRPDGGFFSLVGAEISATGREVRKWDQPLLKETGVGAVVLVCYRGKFLLQAKQEPGNDAKGKILLAATLQASKSNLDAIHGGKRPPRTELISDSTIFYSFCQDGGRFLNKRNEYAVIEIDEEIEPNSNERWFSYSELKDVILSGEANEHLMQAFVIWDCQ